MPKFTDFPVQYQAYLNEIQVVAQEVIASGWYLLGNRLEVFEQAFADYCQVKYCIGVANGFDALQLSLMAFKELGLLQSGDEILIPANTVVATALAVTQQGFKLKLVDPNPTSFNLDAAEIERAISPKTKAIIPVHLYGRAADFHSLLPQLKQQGILVLEDVAQAHGAKINKHMTGGMGNAGAFSFYPTKNLGAMGDAGAITTNDKDMAKILRKLRNYGGLNYQFDYQGINSRLNELQAAILTVRLKYLDQENERRKNIANRYLKGLSSTYLQLPLSSNRHQEVWHQFVIKSPYRNQLKTYLAKQEIPTLIHYPTPIHHQKAFAEWRTCSLPISEQLSEQILSLPIAPHLSDDEVSYIMEQINRFEPVC